MNVTCGACSTTYRVDPAKVPPAGVRARCVCDAVFWVRLPRDVETTATVAAAPAATRPTTVVNVPVAQAASAAPQPVVVDPIAPNIAAVTRPVEPVPSPLPAATAVMTPAPFPVVAPAADTILPVVAPPTPTAAPLATRPPAISGRASARPANPFLSQDPAVKARRLARALVSDMVAYNPVKRADGLRDGTLKQLFEDEIRKSWEEFADQVGRDVAESTPYFREALNEILSDGNPLF